MDEVSHAISVIFEKLRHISETRKDCTYNVVVDPNTFQPVLSVKNCGTNPKVDKLFERYFALMGGEVNYDKITIKYDYMN